MGIFQNPEILFYHFFRIFNLDNFWVLILQKYIGSRYLVPLTPSTVFGWSFWNFTGALRMRMMSKMWKVYDGRKTDEWTMATGHDKADLEQNSRWAKLSSICRLPNEPIEWMIKANKRTTIKSIQYKHIFHLINTLKEVKVHKLSKRLWSGMLH